MKIVYSIGNIANSGGMERILCSKANYLVEQLDFEVYIVVPKSETKSFFSYSNKVQFQFLDIKAKPPRFPISFFSKYQKEYRKELTNFLNVIKPDITISFFGKDADFLYQIKDGSIKVLEFHFTKYYLKYLGESLINDRFRFIRKYWLQYLLLREAQIARKYRHIVVLTEKEKHLWGGGEKFKVIPNPLSFESEKVSRLDQKTILSIGRLVLPKGFQFLIQAFSLIEKECKDWKLIIYGDGHDKEILINLIKSLSLQDKVRIESSIKNVHSVLLESSLFVFPSLYEGFGLVLTEAMECGVPCIAFDCECGPSEIIQDNEDGFIVPLSDVKSLADKMKVLMLNTSLRVQMGKKAKGNVKRFQIDKVMKEWDVYFHQLTDKKK